MIDCVACSDKIRRLRERLTRASELFFAAAALFTELSSLQSATETGGDRKELYGRFAAAIADRRVERDR